MTNLDRLFPHLTAQAYLRFSLFLHTIRNKLVNFNYCRIIVTKLSKKGSVSTDFIMKKHKKNCEIFIIRWCYMHSRVHHSIIELDVFLLPLYEKVASVSLSNYWFLNIHIWVCLVYVYILIRESFASFVHYNYTHAIENDNSTTLHYLVYRTSWTIIKKNNN